MAFTANFRQVVVLLDDACIYRPAAPTCSTDPASFYLQNSWSQPRYRIAADRPADGHKLANHRSHRPRLSSCRAADPRPAARRPAAAADPGQAPASGLKRRALGRHASPALRQISLRGTPVVCPAALPAPARVVPAYRQAPSYEGSGMYDPPTGPT